LEVPEATLFDDILLARPRRLDHLLPSAFVGPFNKPRAETHGGLINN
jgi:hypothetical protein